MKLALHKKKLILFVPIGETDGLRKIGFFEDYDETFLNYNISSISKSIEYTCEETLNSTYSFLENKKNKKNFLYNLNKGNNDK